MQNIADLISLHLLQLDPRISHSRDTLWRSVVETALYYESRPLSTDDINKAVSKLLEQPKLNLSDELSSAIQGSIERGNIAREGELFALSEASKAHIKEAVLQYQCDEENFDKDLTECIESELGSTLGDKSVLSSSVKYALEEMFRARGVEIERRLSKTPFQLEDIIKAGASYDFTKSIEDNLKLAILLGSEAKERIMQGIRQHFRELHDGPKRYVSRLYLKVFYHQILNLDPSFHQQERDYFSKTRLYLDTNALMAYLFDAHLLHDTTLDVIDSSKRLAIQIMISPATLKEMEYQVAKAQHLFSSLGSDQRIMKLLTETAQGRQSNPIIATFGIKAKANPSLLWSNFIAPYTNEDLEGYLLQKLIVVEKESYDAVRNDPNYSMVWQTIREVRHEGPSDEIVYHDSDNFVLIHLLRRNHKSKPMGHTVWLGTWDSSLRETEGRLTWLYPFPHSKMIDEWGEIIMPFQNINNFIYRDYVLFLVRSRLGIPLDMSALDLDFLEPLHRPAFDVDALLELDDSQYVVEILAKLQMNRGMRELSERARTAETPEEIAEINRQLSPCLLETIVSDKKAAEEESKESTRKAQQLEAKLAEKDKAVADLAQRIHEIETRTMWQKLKAFIGLTK